jgi:hypothetical protein
MRLIDAWTCTVPFIWRHCQRSGDAHSVSAGVVRPRTPKASRGPPGNLGITEALHQPSSKRRLKGIEFEIRLGKIVRKGVPELQSST